MRKCNLNCKKEFSKPHNININMGFMEIIQKQCPFCQMPIETEMNEIGDLAITKNGCKIKPKTNNNVG